MSGLDFQYIAELVMRAQEGDANAFAELFAATYQKQFAFACAYLGERYLAQEALQDTYIQALKSLGTLREPALIAVWLNRMLIKSCMRIQYRSELQLHGSDAQNPENRILEIDGRPFNVRQIMTLPFSEAQSILLNSMCGMKTGEIASLLEIRRSEVRRSQEMGRKRLKTLSGGKGDASR